MVRCYVHYNDNSNWKYKWNRSSFHGNDPPPQKSNKQRWKKIKHFQVISLIQINKYILLQQYLKKWLSHCIVDK